MKNALQRSDPCASLRIRCVKLLILLLATAPILLACGSGTENSSPSLDLFKMQERSNISGLYKFLNGDCGVDDNITIYQSNENVEVQHGSKSFTGVSSLSPGGDAVVSFGDEASCLGVLNNELLSVSCFSENRSCTMHQERIKAFDAKLPTNAYGTGVDLPPADVSGELELVSTNCPFPEAVPGKLIINQTDNDIQIRTWLYISLGASIAAHGSNASVGFLKLDDSTPCHSLMAGGKMAVICSNGERSCGIQYSYK